MAEPTLLQRARHHLGPSRALEFRDSNTLALDRILQHLEAQAAEDAARRARYEQKLREYEERVRSIDAGLGDPAQGNAQPASVIADDDLTALERLCAAPKAQLGEVARVALPKLIAEVRRLRKEVGS